MTNYDLEEVKLLKWQYGLSLLFIITVIISLSLTHNEILKLQKKKPLYSKEDENNVLTINRILGFLIALAFVAINIEDKSLKQTYTNTNLKNADLQIDASILTLIATIIVLYVAINGENESIEIENPQI